MTKQQKSPQYSIKVNQQDYLLVIDPISLKSCLGKTAERMVNNRLYHWLEQNKLFNIMQAGLEREVGQRIHCLDLSRTS